MILLLWYDIIMIWSAISYKFLIEIRQLISNIRIVVLPHFRTSTSTLQHFHSHTLSLPFLFYSLGVTLSNCILFCPLYYLLTLNDLLWNFRSAYCNFKRNFTLLLSIFLTSINLSSFSIIPHVNYFGIIMRQPFSWKFAKERRNQN